MLKYIEYWGLDPILILIIYINIKKLFYYLDKIYNINFC